VTQNAIATKLTNASIANQTAAVQANIDAKAYRQSIVNATTDIAGIEALQGMNARQLQNMGSALSAVNQQKQYELSVAAHARDAAAHELRMKEYTAKAAKEVIADAELAEVIANVNRGEAAMGRKLSTPATVKFNMGSDKAPLHAHMMTMYTNGAMMSQTGKAFVAPTLGASGLVLEANNWGYVTANPESAPLVAVIKEAQDGVLKANPTLANGTKQGLMQLQDTTTMAAKTMLDLQQATIKPGTEDTNAYAAPPLPILAKDPVISKLAIYPLVIGPRAVAGEKTLRSEDVVSGVASAIQSGKISMEQGAADIATLYSKAIGINNTTKSYDAFGAPVQTKYNGAVPGLMFGYNYYNLADINQVNKALNLMAAKQRDERERTTEGRFLNNIGRSIIDN